MLVLLISVKWNKVVNVKKVVVDNAVTTEILNGFTRFGLYDYCFQPKLSFHYSDNGYHKKLNGINLKLENEKEKVERYWVKQTRVLVLRKMFPN